MNSISIQGAALVAMLVAMPLISWGTTSDFLPATIAAAVLIVAGSGSLTLTRFLDLQEDE